MIALDFGTRTVICCEYDDENVTRVGITEHQSRAMREGAVTDMQSAVESLTRIHKKMGLSKDVATTFAIAGSQLIVRKLDITIESHGPWSETQLQNIESDKFEEHFHSERDSDLVPLGVIRTSCTVDGRRVSNVVGMAGERCHYCALVTLLPVRNITSKMKAVEQAGFRPVSITIEPIAIANALFEGKLPPRPFALVDIGAGTSDIAVMDQDGVTGVASLPVAGDTVTDSIATAFDLSYIDADALKIHQKTEVQNIWGEKEKYTAAKIQAAAKDGVNLLVSGITESISSLTKENGIEELGGLLLVGGGSLWPGLDKLLAKALKMLPKKVRVRHAESIPGINDSTGRFKGPAFVTASGIILSKKVAFEIKRYFINGEECVSIARTCSEKPFSIADALEAAGLDPLDFFGEPGDALVSNDEVIAGEAGSSPVILLNGEIGELDSPLGDNAEITINAGDAGQGATLTKIESEGFITIDNKPISCGKRFDVEKVSESEFRTKEITPPLLDSVIKLPIERSISINIQGRNIEFRDKTRSVSDGTNRIRHDQTLTWDSKLDTSRGDWRLYELILDQKQAINLRVNNQPANYLTVVSDGDEVSFS